MLNTREGRYVSSLKLIINKLSDNKISKHHSEFQ